MNVTTTRKQVQDTLDKANDIDIALERGATVSDDHLSIQRNLLQDLCLLALAPSPLVAVKVEALEKACRKVLICRWFGTLAECRDPKNCTQRECGVGEGK